MSDPKQTTADRQPDTTADWNGIPPNGQGMYHWLVNKDHRRHVVAWFDLHEWTAFGRAQTKQEIAAMYDYVAPCDPPGHERKSPMLTETTAPMAVRCLGTVTFLYTNWRGETRHRRAVFESLSFGSTDWHPDPQWFVDATDLDDPADLLRRRQFALRDMKEVTYAD